MEFVSNIVLAFQVSEQPTAKLRAADALGNMGSSVSNFGSFMIHFYGYFFNKNKPGFLDFTVRLYGGPVWQFSLIHDNR